MCETAKAYLNGMARLLGEIDCRGIDDFAELMVDAWRNDRRVFVFGNGGSATTASHHACDLMKTAAVDGQRRLNAFSLVDNVGIGTAIGNDLDYEQVFVYLLETYAKRGDLAVAISGSGNSPNVLRACTWARRNGVKVIALTGFSGGKLKDLADLHINIPSDNYGYVEDLHLAIGHMVAQILKARISAEAKNT